MLVLYYHLIGLLDASKHSFYVNLITHLLYSLAACSPLIYLVRKLINLQTMRNARSKILAEFQVIFRRYLIFTLIVTVIVLSLEIFLALILLYPVESDIHVYVKETELACDSIRCVVWRTIEYIDSRLGWSNSNPMSALEINNMLSQVDYLLLGILGFTPAHVILWQGWGSCGEHAIVTAYLLHRLGYEVRVTHFNDIDHVWAEVHVNGSWYIVDPWYIGLVYKNQYHGGQHLVPSEILASLKHFSGNHRVTCTYLNGTQTSCSDEHGYQLESEGEY